MEAAIRAASGLVSTVLNHLGNKVVEAYVDSLELSVTSQKIKEDLDFTQGLLHAAEQSGVIDNPGLEGLLRRLHSKADEAEDALDELHYFIIQDQFDGTHYAVPDLGNSLWGHAHHIHHAILHTVGNFVLPCFSCWLMQDDDHGAAVINDPHNTTNPGSGNDGPVDKLSFDRVAMSKKIKSVIQDLHSQCDSVFKLLQIMSPHGSTESVNLERPRTSPITGKDRLFGRRDEFEKVIQYIITNDTNSSKPLSVISIVGPGGIGKTTFTQYLYNDKRTQQHFPAMAWVCVSNDFDVLKLSQQILSKIEDNNNAYQTTSFAQLQQSIAEKLKSKRFLIVFDDIWGCDQRDWENLLAPFGKGETKGNMVLVTTRFPSIADMVEPSLSIPLKGLEPEDFFTLFESFIFDGEKPAYQDDLIHIARDIAERLKGSPLAGKTVGKLLKKKPQEHWMEILKNKEWQSDKNAYDIMPSLRISYDYLPFYLKKCFQYFALFPEDYRFRHLEIKYFLISIGIVDKEVNYMEELVGNGFLVKENDDLENQYYILHDLLHELSRSVSSQQCLNIDDGACFRADVIPTSIRHLSITMEDRYEGNFKEEMVKLRSKIANLRTLMIFRQYGETIDEILKHTFKEIEGLRILFIVVKSPESLPCNLSKLIHLRYLKVSTFNSEVTLPRSLSRFYHLILLDLRGWYGRSILPKDISRLANLIYFFAKKKLHSNVPDVGRMKCLKELKEFCVKKEDAGFELSEVGELTELEGELGIYNLEKVATKEESMKAKLVSKRLEELRLVWGGTEHRRGEYDFFYGTSETSDFLDGTTDSSDSLDAVAEPLDLFAEFLAGLDDTTELSDVVDDTTEISDVLDGLEPHPELLSLVIKNHGGSIGPSWLCGNISTKGLVSLHLECVSWVTLPPFGLLHQLRSLVLIDISGLGQIKPGFGGVTDESFLHLKVIFLHTLPEFTEWVGAPNARAFSGLEKIYCSDCPNLLALPFLQECSSGSYTSLSTLVIDDCPRLFLPPMPHTSTLTIVEVSFSPAGTGSMVYHGYSLSLSLEGYSGVLALHNMAGKLESIEIIEGSNFPWAQLPKATFLSKIAIKGDPNFLSMSLLSNCTSLAWLELLDCTNMKVDGFNPLIAAVNLKRLEIHNSRRNFPSVAADILSELVVASRTKLLTAGCFKLEELAVDCKISAVLASPICNLFAATLNKLTFWYDDRVESFTEEEEKALQVLTSLKSLSFYDCLGLPSLPQGLHSLPSLRSLFVRSSPEIKSLPQGGLPTSLRSLSISECSLELKEQVEELKGTNPDLWVSVH